MSELHKTFVKHKKLAHPPIFESVLHIRCDLHNLLPNSADSLSVLSQVLDEFEVKHTGQIWEARFSPEKAQAEKTLVGERFASDDGKHVVQVFPNGVAVSLLRPYPDWSVFSGYAINCWESLVDAAGAILNVERIGLRAINKIELPKGPGSIDSLFGEGSPQGLISHCTGKLQRQGFLFCESVRDIERDVQANITRTMQPPTIDSHGNPILLYDIDAFTFPKKEIGKEGIVREVEKLHEFRNEIFFSEMSKCALESFS